MGVVLEMSTLSPKGQVTIPTGVLKMRFEDVRIGRTQILSPAAYVRQCVG